MDMSRDRAVTVQMPGEALGSALARLRFDNEIALRLGLPTWRAETVALPGDAHRLILTAPYPRLGDHVLLGTYSSGTGTVARLPGAVSPAAGPPEPAVCAHCGTRRAKLHYVFCAPDGRIVLLGAGCLPAHLGSPADEQGGSPEAVRRLLQRALADPAQSLQDTASSVAGATHYDTNRVIASALWITEEYGYVSRAKSDRLGLRATADEMRATLENGPAEPAAPVAARLLPAAVIRQWALDDMPADTDFSARLKEAVARPTVSRHAFGVLASLPTVYRRAAREEDARNSGDPLPGEGYAGGYLLAPGQRSQFEGVLVEDVRLLDSGSTLLVMRATTGHRLTWFASTAPSGEFPALGARVSLVGTVKAHREFRGITDTVLTRCRFLT